MSILRRFPRFRLTFHCNRSSLTELLVRSSDKMRVWRFTDFNPLHDLGAFDRRSEQPSSQWNS
jgi:hypothetical protein